jgi:sulfane dehydrogenase subunit SoxC
VKKHEPEQDPKISRRELVRSAGLVAGAALAAPFVSAAGQAAVQTPAAPAPIAVPPDATKIPGLGAAGLNARSPFENPSQLPVGITTGSTNTPHQRLSGTITPSDLHFQRHHNGIAVLDPSRHTLLVHGLVDRPLSFTVEDLKRFPSVSRTCFVECSGNGRSAYRAPKAEMSPQDVDGLTSNSEWTGVLVSTLLREAGVQRGAKWVLAEGGDAAELSRSVPIEKMQDDAIVAYAQNGEPVRMANGYPMRLVLPGYEGNTCIKWLRRLKAIDQPNMSRDETSKYTDPLPDGTSRQFSLVMDAKSIITSPAFPEKLAGAGWRQITGIAWTGRGKIIRVDVSTDDGRTWTEAELVGAVLPMAHTRFQLMWNWNGKAARLQSRAIDETGYTQPTLAEFKTGRGTGTDYHFNAIRTWAVGADGVVTFVA